MNARPAADSPVNVSGATSDGAAPGAPTDGRATTARSHRALGAGHATARPAATATEAAEGQGRLPRPPAFGFPGATWREIAYLLANLPVGMFGFVYVTSWVFASVALSITVVGLPMLALGLLGSRQIGKFERWRARTLLDVHVDEPSPLRHRAHGGFFP